MARWTTADRDPAPRLRACRSRNFTSSLGRLTLIFIL
jgi:hypothetical protein